MKCSVKTTVGRKSVNDNKSHREQGQIKNSDNYERYFIIQLY